MNVPEYLLDIEWSIGGGHQCPECYGSPESALGHPLHLTPDTLGHTKGCRLAAAIKQCGGHPLFQGESKLTTRYESYITNEGIYSTRKLV